MKYCPGCRSELNEIRNFCPECGFKFSIQTNLKHTVSEEPIQYIIDDRTPEELSKKVRTCPVCGKKFTKRWRQIRCRDCEKDFKLKEKDQIAREGYEITERHIQRMAYNREFPFYCKWCGKRFKAHESDICERHENYQCPKRH